MPANVTPLKRPAEPAALHHSTAAVTGTLGPYVLVDHPACAKARVAVSCLVVPSPGDTVMLALTENGHEAYILAILDRPNAHAATLDLGGGNKLVSRSGTLQVQSNDLQLDGVSSMAFRSASLDVDAVTANVRVKHGQAWFDTLESCAVSITQAAKTVSWQIGRLVQRLKESVRYTEGLDETRAGRVRIDVDGHHHLRAGHLTHTAQGFVKIDGQKIDLG